MSVQLRLNPNILELQKRASVYMPVGTLAEGNFYNVDGIGLCPIQTSSHASLSHAQVRAWIKSVLQDDNFLADPKKYVTEWNDRKPTGYPHYYALQFFLQNIKLL